MILHSQYRSLSCAALASILVGASACAPVAPSIDKNKFISQRQAPATTAPDPSAEKQQIVHQTTSTQVELQRRSSDIKALETFVQAKKDSGLVIIRLNPKSKELGQLLSAEGFTLVTPKLQAKRVVLWIVRKPIAKAQKEDSEDKSTKEADSKPSKDVKDVKDVVTVTQEASLPEFTVTSTTEDTLNEITWHFALDQTVSDEEKKATLAIEDIDSAAIVIVPKKQKKTEVK